MKELYCKSIKGKTYRITKTSMTFLLNIIDEKSLNDDKYYFQITNKDPWFIPKKDTICDGKVTLWGWLFVYVGCDTKMLRRR